MSRPRHIVECIHTHTESLVTNDLAQWPAGYGRQYEQRRGRRRRRGGQWRERRATHVLMTVLSGDKRVHRWHLPPYGKPPGSKHTHCTGTIGKQQHRPRLLLLVRTSITSDNYIACRRHHHRLALSEKVGRLFLLKINLCLQSLSRLD